MPLPSGRADAAMCRSDPLAAWGWILDDGAMSDQPRADPGDHIAVIAALGRLGMVGGWDRMRAGQALDGLDRADADLLLAAGMLERTGADRFTVLDDDLVDLDGTTVGHAMVALLRRALEHTERRSAGWGGATADTVLSQGRGSRAAADHIARELLPRMPGSRDCARDWDVPVPRRRGGGGRDRRTTVPALPRPHRRGYRRAPRGASTRGGRAHRVGPS